MTTHAAHVNDELLSAYLDGELPARQAEAVEDHLEHCSGCRTRLAGLRRVVGTLARLEAAAPPPVLAQRVERRVALVEREAGFFESLERHLKGLSLDSPLVVTFAVILALAVIVYLFSHGVANRHADISIHVASPDSVEGLMRDTQAVEVEGRQLVREGDVWRQVGVGGEEGGVDEAGTDVAAGAAGGDGIDAAPGDAASGGPAAGNAQSEGRPALRTVTWDSEEGRSLRREHPWIDELLSLTGTQALLFEVANGEPVRLTRDAATDNLPSSPPSPPER